MQNIEAVIFAFSHAVLLIEEHIEENASFASFYYNFIRVWFSSLHFARNIPKFKNKISSNCFLFNYKTSAYFQK